MSKDLVYDNVVKKFRGKGNQEITALAGVSFEIRSGELFCLLGPSGCGKTTLMRCTAGLETLTSGRILYGGTNFNEIPPHRRNIGMVFQKFALFPHMTVFENVAYGLRIRKLEEAEIRRRVTEAMELVGLPDILKRDQGPTALSGGQQQRVAIARALVYEPEILLLDEPLANLDAKLRRHMRTEIRRIQKQANVTAIYVTHDQEEAMAIADRLAVMNKGKVEQIGSPDEVYRRPKTPFVADFIGKMNFFQGTVTAVHADMVTIRLDMDETSVTTAALYEGDTPLSEGTRVLLCYRPEHLTVSKQAGQGVVRGRVQIIQHLGQVVRYEVGRPNGQVVEVDVDHRVSGIAEGDEVYVAPKREEGLIFRADAPGAEAVSVA